MELVRAKKEEIEIIAELYHDACANLEENINYPGWRKDIYPCLDDALSYFEQDVLYVLKNNDEIIGTVALLHQPQTNYELVPWQKELDYKNVWVICTLAIHPKYQKNCVGQELMELIKIEAIKQEIEALRLDIYIENIPAKKLYEKCGYKYLATIDMGLGDIGLNEFAVYESLL